MPENPIQHEPQVAVAYSRAERIWVIHDPAHSHTSGAGDLLPLPLEVAESMASDIPTRVNWCPRCFDAE